jgi:WhiB family redox-sensing transcriptional regulator
VSGLAHLGGPRPAAPNLGRQTDDWRQEAACRPGSGVDPETFYPGELDTPKNRTQTAEAKAICAQCPARQACLAWALENDEYAIAGGLTVKERGRLRKQSRIINHGTITGFYQHRDSKIAQCEPCREAHRAHERAKYIPAAQRRASVETLELVRVFTNQGYDVARISREIGIGKSSIHRYQKQLRQQGEQAS